jgi:hypothetical protein
LAAGYGSQYAGLVDAALTLLPAVCFLLISASPQSKAQPPRFVDYPVTEDWRGIPAPPKLATATERMFRTRLTNAAKEPPNFADHYRITYWGCGSECSAGAVIDLQTGDVFSPPLGKPSGRGWEKWIMCPASFEGSNDEFHLDSRLIIVHCGLNYSDHLQKNVPDTYYFVWEQDHFRKLFFVSGKAAGQ